jgi:hypothetical protein
MSKCNFCEERHCNKNTKTYAECRKRVRLNYEHFCNEYLRLFCLKHDFDFEGAKSSWVANDVGSIVSCGDYCFDMNVIRTDIDEYAPKEELLKWYDYSLEVEMLGVKTCNYHSWLHHCPILSKEKINTLKQLRHNVEEAERELKKELDKYNEYDRERKSGDASLQDN